MEWMVIETISRALKIRSIYKYKYFYAWPEPHSGDLNPFGAILTATSQFPKPILLFHCKLTLSFNAHPNPYPRPHTHAIIVGPNHSLHVPTSDAVQSHAMCNNHVDVKPSKK